MDFINHIIHKEYLEAIGWTLIHAVWQIMAVSLLLWIVLKLCPKQSSQFKYSAGLLALSLIVIASSWTFSTVLEPITGSSDGTALDIPQQHIQVATLEKATVSTHSPQQGLFEQAFSQQLETFLPTVVNLWLLGALFFLVKLTGSLLDLRNLHKKHHQEVPDTLIKKVNSMIASIGFYRKVRVLKSQVIHVPITYGILKPIILIPAGLLLHTSPQQLEAVIAHELAHIKRYDYLVNIIQHVLEVLFFFHPCFWWINEIIRTERENACDDMVLKLGFSPHDLAYGLAEVAEHAHNATPDMALAATGSQNPTLNRIKRILGIQSQKEKISPLITLTMIISLMVSASLVMGAIPSQKEDLDKNYISTHLKSNTIIKEWHFPCPEEESGYETKTVNHSFIKANSENSLTKSVIQVIKKNNEPALDTDHEVVLGIEDVKTKTAEKNKSLKVTTNNHPNQKYNYSYSYSYQSDTTPKSKRVVTVTTSPDDDPMPILKLSPVPTIDVNIPPVPAIPPMDNIPFAPPHPDVQLDLSEEGMRIGKIALELSSLGRDSSRQAELKRKKLESQLEKLESEMEVKTKIYEEQMKAWEKDHSEAIKEWEAKMEAWEREMEKKQGEWETAFAPKMKEFEKKMEAWEKENEPKIKEFEKKMKDWEKRQKEREKELIEP